RATPPHCCRRVSNVRYGDDSGTTRPAREVWAWPLSMYPTTSATTSVEPWLLKMRTLPSSPTGTNTRLALIEFGARLRFDVVGSAPPRSLGNSDRWVALPPVIPTMLSRTPVTLGLAGTTSGTVGLTPSTPRIGSTIVSFGPRGAAGVRLTFWPARVSSTRDGVVGMSRAPPAEATSLGLLVENQPNTSTMTWAVPDWPNRPISSCPSAPGRTIDTLGTV